MTRLGRHQPSQQADEKSLQIGWWIKPDQKAQCDEQAYQRLRRKADRPRIEDYISANFLPAVLLTRARHTAIDNVQPR